MLFYSESFKEFAGPISASLRLGITTPIEEMSQLWLTVSSTASDLTGRRFEPKISRSGDERVTADVVAGSQMILGYADEHHYQQ